MKSVVIAVTMFAATCLSLPVTAQEPAASGAEAPVEAAAPAETPATPPAEAVAPAETPATPPAEAAPAGPPSGEPITVEPSFAGRAGITAREPFVLRLSRPLKKPEEARIAVVIGTTDISGLLDAGETELRYQPKVAPLPAGDQEMTVFLCTSDKRWIEISKIPVRVLGRFGFEKSEFRPKLDVAMNGQVAEDHFPEDAPPPRDTFQDMTVTAGLDTDLLRRQFNMRSQLTLVGFSNQEQALRFGEKGPEAPQFDLGNYLITLQQGSINATLGNLSLASGNRLLMENFQTRGTSLAVKLGQRLDLRFDATAGTNVVGFDNIVGFSERDHSVLAGTLGLEILPRAGGLRLETTILDGRVLARSPFNAGVVNDPARNRALGLRLIGSLPSQRVRLDAGFTRSEFTNPPDPLLEQGFDVVPVQEENRNARYLDLAFDVLQNVQLGASRTATLSVVLRHEKIDPLFRTITATRQADLMTNQIELNATVADISVQATHARLEDNLEGVESILKTLTRRNFVGVGIPLAPVLGMRENPSPLLPTLSFTFDRTHQFGDSNPVNGEFDEASEVPDQVSTAKAASAEWRFTRFSVRYGLNHSAQDNRQSGRENSDLTNLNQAVQLSVNPFNTLSFSLEGALERAKNKELDQTNRTRRVALNGNWAALSNLNFALQAAHTLNEDAADTNSNEAFQLSATGSFGFPIYKTMRAQLSLALNRTFNHSVNTVFETDSESSNTTVNTGISISFF